MGRYLIFTCDITFLNIYIKWVLTNIFDSLYWKKSGWRNETLYLFVFSSRSKSLSICFSSGRCCSKCFEVSLLRRFRVYNSYSYPHFLSFSLSFSFIWLKERESVCVWMIVSSVN
jgi:hypothetical protein